MKTFYTLLLAFGLCLTSHAQDLQVLSNVNNVQLSQNETDEFNELTYSATHSVVFGDNTTTIYNDSTPVKRVIIETQAGVALLNSYTTSLNSVKSLELYWHTNEVYNFSSQLNQKLPSLKFIYVKSYEMLNQSNVQTIIGPLQEQFPNAKIVYQTLKDS